MRSRWERLQRLQQPAGLHGPRGWFPHLPGAGDRRSEQLDQTPASFTWTIDLAAPTVTIEQATGQPDPTGASPINFTVVFSEAVTGFADADVSLSGTAGATTAVVTGGPTTYNVAVSGMTADGTVTASIGAGVASDIAGNAQRRLHEHGQHGHVPIQCRADGDCHERRARPANRYTAP